jgi:hypothetical protein
MDFSCNPKNLWSANARSDLRLLVDVSHGRPYLKRRWSNACRPAISEVRSAAFRLPGEGREAAETMIDQQG